MRVEELSGPELRHLLAGTALAVAEGAGKGGPIEELERLLRRCGELYRALKRSEERDRAGAINGKGEGEGTGTAQPSAPSSPSAPH